MFGSDFSCFLYQNIKKANNIVVFVGNIWRDKNVFVGNMLRNVGIWRMHTKCLTKWVNESGLWLHQFDSSSPQGSIDFLIPMNSVISRSIEPLFFNSFHSLWRKIIVLDNLKLFFLLIVYFKSGAGFGELYWLDSYRVGK